MKKFGFNKYVVKFTKERDSDCQIFTKKGKLVSHFTTADGQNFWDKDYTPFSLDGKYLFIPKWERALFCYEISTGKLVWKKSPGKIGDMVVLKDYILVEMKGRGLYKREIKTGELLQQIKMNSIDIAKQVDSNEIFVGPKNNKYFILELPSLKQKRVIPLTSLNIRNCLSFVIRKVWKTNGVLFIEGFESYPDRDNNKKGTRSFVREIGSNYTKEIVSLDENTK